MIYKVGLYQPLKAIMYIKARTQNVTFFYIKIPLHNTVHPFFFFYQSTAVQEETPNTLYFVMKFI
jgi:hypothetical protein